jgi:hypothetical protein
MKKNKNSLLVIAITLLMASLPAFAQQSFSDINVDYSFNVPDEKWKMTVKPSKSSPNVEYVYGDRFDGHLEVRRLTVEKDSLLTDAVENEEQKLRFRPGFVAGRQENFTGKLRGSIFNFEYVAAGKNMSGRYYFLRANDTTIYVLRFSGQKDSLRSLQPQTDSIARSFAVKAG